MTDNLLAASLERIAARVADASYETSVYAGLLGKVIGVYAGRPMEGWTYEQVVEAFGSVDRFVHGEVGQRLIVTDDDIAGTVSFLRPFTRDGHGYEVTSDDIADVWLNDLVEERSVLWWGGMGNSTEHTAYLRLKEGHRPPHSGAITTNGQTVAEQIGAQIFIDGWGLISPGEPELAAELAQRAAVVSHDAEAVHAAQVVAAMVAQAFVTDDPSEVVSVGLAQIPQDCLVAQLIRDVQKWHREIPDWVDARTLLEEKYGYHIYGGNCHVIPNHGLVVLSVLYGHGDFTRSIEIVNTSGWDTDCNSGNVGAIVGVLSGLDAIEEERWRQPVADRIYLSTAEPGHGVSDVLTEARRVVRAVRSTLGVADGEPADGARFHFSQPGAVQGFTVTGAARVENTDMASQGHRALQITSEGAARVTTPVFFPPEDEHMSGYPLDATPQLHPGQVVTFRLSAASGDATVRPVARQYDGDEVIEHQGEALQLSAQPQDYAWQVPGASDQPLIAIGLAFDGESQVQLHSLDWTGVPSVTFTKPASGGHLWRRAWISTLDYQHHEPPEMFRLVSNRDRRLLYTGSVEWADYRVEATLTPHMAAAYGVVARIQGIERYYLAEIVGGSEVRLVRRYGEDEVLATAAVDWPAETRRRLALELNGQHIRVLLDGQAVLDHDDPTTLLLSGGVGAAVEEGRVGFDSLSVTPLERQV